MGYNNDGLNWWIKIQVDINLKPSLLLIEINSEWIKYGSLKFKEMTE